MSPNNTWNNNAMYIFIIVILILVIIFWTVYYMWGFNDLDTNDDSDIINVETPDFDTPDVNIWTGENN